MVAAPMRRSSLLMLWGGAAAAAAPLLIWGYPLAAPFQPRHWRTSAGQAEAIVLDHLRQLGRQVQRPLVAPRLATSSCLERRLQLALAHEDLARLRATGLPDQVSCWELTVYPPDALHGDYAAKAQVSLGGSLTSLRWRVDAEARSGALAPAAARDRADALLRAQGVDPGRYGEPEVRTQQ